MIMMKSPRSHPAALSCLLLGALSTSSTTTAFIAPPTTAATTTTTTTTTKTTSSALHASSFTSTPPTEDQARHLLQSASLCAHSDNDSCSVESAEYYLREIVHLQSGCAAGSLYGKEVCEDVVEVSEVVAALREKVRGGVEKEVKTFWDQRQEEFNTLITSSLASDGTSGLSPLASWANSPLKPGYIALAAVYTVMIMGMLQDSTLVVSGSGHNAVVPFTPQEVWWSIRDGYFNDLISHFYHHGGLFVGDYGGDSIIGTTTTAALTPQEVWWSIRDGYFGDTLFSSFASSSTTASTTASAAAAASNNVDVMTEAEGGVMTFTGQEVWWALRDGYAADLIGHWFRNNGLLV